MLTSGVPAGNYLAEPSLRPLVLLRKARGGARSDADTQTCLSLANLLATWQAGQLNPFLEYLAALQQVAPTALAASP